MLSKTCFIALLLQSVVSQVLIEKNLTASDAETLAMVSDLSCKYAPGLKVGNTAHVAKCCKELFINFHSNWFRGKYYLTTFLETMKGWNCSQFDSECEKRTFAFTTFDKLIYDRFCDSKELLKRCDKKLPFLLPRNKSFISINSSESVYSSEWKNLVVYANFSLQDQLQYPCVQVAMYDNERGGFGNYHEIVKALLPFCGLIRCGYGGDTLRSEDIYTWTCMPEKCRVNNIVTLVVVGLLCLAIVISNLTVLHVLAHYRNLRNSQAYYKASLAVADLLVGAIVLPNFIVSEMKIFLTRHFLGDLETVHGYLVNQADQREYIKSTAQVRVAGTRFEDSFTQTYMNFVGFVTTVSLVVSVYTLMVATFDRFWAIFRPMRFIKHRTKRNAKYISIFLWIIAGILAALPIFAPGMKYALVASVLVCSVGTQAAIFYIVAFLVPLIAVWTTTIATYYISKREGIQRRILTQQNDEKKLHQMEWRLTKTLAIMVVVFTFSLVPVVAVTIIPFLKEDVHIFSPEKLNPEAVKIHTTLEHVAIIILMSNSLWNCFIYNMKNREFSRASKQSYRNLMGKLGFSFWTKSNEELFSLSARGRTRKRISSATPVTTESKA